MQKFKAYASYFVSYLLNNLGDSDINKIILFGSVARGEISKDSDVDIFIDVKRKDKKFEKKVEKILEGFYKSREGIMFKSVGVDNKINFIVGKLDEWIDLRESIENTWIVLYGPYISGRISGKIYIGFLGQYRKK